MLKGKTIKCSIFCMLMIFISFFSTFATDSTNLIGQLDQIIDIKKFSSARKDDYVVTTKAFSVSSQTTSNEIDYYYYVNQKYNLTPNPSDTLGPFKKVKSYKIELFPSYDLNVIAAYPNTTEGETSDSTSETISLGGTVGFFGTEPTAGLNVDISITTSHSFSESAVVVTNNSSFNGEVSWDFNIAPESPVSNGGYSPEIQWVWQTKKGGIGPDALVFNTNLTVNFADDTTSTYSGYRLNVITPPDPGIFKAREKFPLPVNVEEEEFIYSTEWPRSNDPLVGLIMSYSSQISEFTSWWDRDVIRGIGVKYADGTTGYLGFTPQNPLFAIADQIGSIGGLFHHFASSTVTLQDKEIVSAATLCDSGFGYRSLRQIHLTTTGTDGASQTYSAGPEGIDSSFNAVEKGIIWRGILASINTDRFITGLSFIYTS